MMVTGMACWAIGLIGGLIAGNADRIAQWLVR